jgi:hypothetical protein
MPFKSKTQQAFLFSQHPEVAEEFADHTTKSAYKKLPEHVAKDKNRLKAYSKKHRRKSHGKDE